MNALRLVAIALLALTIGRSEEAIALKPAPPDAGTPLYYAAKRNDRAEAIRLAKERTGINELSQQGLSPLYWAIWHKDDELVAELLGNGADAQRISHDRRSALSLAASAGSLALVRKFLALGHDPDPSKNAKGSALYSALCGSSANTTEHWQLVELLIPLTNVAAETGPELTCLYCAASRAPVTVIEALFAHGARIPTTDLLGPILVQTKDAAVMRLLVARGADVKATDRWQRSPLHYIGGSNPEITRFLLDSGVDVNGRSSLGELPLFGALRSPDLTAAKLMLDRGADRTAVDRNGASLLFFAASPPNAAGVAFLLKLGFDPKAKDSRGQTALHATVRSVHDARFERAQVLQLLINGGADANARDAYGATALHIAASRLDRAAIEMLLTNGAQPGAVDASGRTALHVAAAVRIRRHRPSIAGIPPKMLSAEDPYVADQLSGKHEVILLLMRHGASKTARDASNRRPVDVVADIDLDQKSGQLLH